MKKYQVLYTNRNYPNVNIYCKTVRAINIITAVTVAYTVLGENYIIVSIVEIPLIGIFNDKAVSMIEYEVKTNLDNNGGLCFHSLYYAYCYLFDTLKKQTHIELFKSEDFEKIDRIQLVMNIKNIVNETVKFASYRRIDDTEFIKE